LTPDVSVRYLLVSPVLPPLAHTLVPPVSWAGLKGGVEKGTGFGALSCPTLVVWGSVDSFTSNRRLKAWAERLSKAAGGPGMLRWRDFEGAGHFWREAGAMKAMTGEIGEWVRETS
jgi:pimeloyl-ACP methyl ester carboxylesterase